VRAFPGRQLTLFVLSMVIPIVVLVGLTVRMIVQQDELVADEHIADLRRLRVNEFERALAARLDRAQRAPDDPIVALVGTLVEAGSCCRGTAPREPIRPPID
jgi:hypothetical protein